MTAADCPSLDAIIATTQPVEPAPFDLAVILRQHRYAVGEIPNAAQWAITRYVNGLRVDTEKARAWAVAMQGETEKLHARIAEALNYLADALIWCNDGTNTSDCISEAIAALVGDES